jgi:uncharacterized membrane protein YfcA
VPFSAATLIAVAAFAALGRVPLLNSLYLQDVRGFSPLHAGLLTLPMAAMTVLLPPSRAHRGHPRAAAAAPGGGAGIAASGALLLSLDVDTPLLLVVAAYVVFRRRVRHGQPRRSRTRRCPGCRWTQAGVAAGVASTSRQVGSALGVAVLGSLVTAQLGASTTVGFAALPCPPGSS